MEIEIRLAKILKEIHRDRHGIAQQMASDIKVHRHTIRKLMSNELKNPSLDVLGRVCDWLHRHGVTGDRLPQALLGARPSGLLQAISEPGVVTLYVGEYRRKSSSTQILRWIAQHDAVAMAKVAQFLTRPGTDEQRHLSMEMKYIPFQADKDAQALEVEHVREAKKSFQDMQTLGPHQSAILIGSQRANHMVELLVAHLFGCEPFVYPKKRTAHAPFYLVYRKDDRSMTSCFGGVDAPPGCKNAAGPGLYYLDQDRKWVALPWNESTQDAGLIIVLRDTSTTATQLVLFGYSGLGTENVAERLLADTSALWPPTVQVKGRQIGVYVYRFSFTPQDKSDGNAEAYAIKTEFIPLDQKVICQFTE